MSCSLRSTAVSRLFLHVRFCFPSLVSFLASYRAEKMAPAKKSSAEVDESPKITPLEECFLRHRRSGARSPSSARPESLAHEGVVRRGGHFSTAPSRLSRA